MLCIIISINKKGVFIMSVAKVVLRFDVFPQEKEELELVCKHLNCTKVDFLRKAITIAINETYPYALPNTPFDEDGTIL